MTRAHKVLTKKKAALCMQETIEKREEVRENAVVKAAKLLKKWATLRSSMGRAAARFQFRKMHGKSIAEVCRVLNDEMMEVSVAEKLRYPI